MIIQIVFASIITGYVIYHNSRLKEIDNKIFSIRNEIASLVRENYRADKTPDRKKHFTAEELNKLVYDLDLQKLRLDVSCLKQGHENLDALQNEIDQVKKNIDFRFEHFEEKIKQKVISTVAKSTQGNKKK